MIVLVWTPEGTCSSKDRDVYTYNVIYLPNIIPNLLFEYIRHAYLIDNGWMFNNFLL